MTATKVNGKMKHYEVRMNRDGVGYYVVEVIGHMDLFIKGNSLNKQEMIDLAEKLNKEAAE
jgi:hypothetical protein